MNIITLLTLGQVAAGRLDHAAQLDASETFHECSNEGKRKESSALREWYRAHDGDISQLLALSSAQMALRRIKMCEQDIAKGILVDSAKFQKCKQFILLEKDRQDFEHARLALLRKKGRIEDSGAVLLQVTSACPPS